jgi:hypothetical protein
MATAFTLGDEEFAAAAFEHSKEVANGIDIPYRFAEYMFQNKVEEREGGIKATVEWSVRRHSETTAIKTGYEPIRFNIRPTLKAGFFEDRIGVRPLVIGLKEEIQNRGRTAMINILKERMMDNKMARLEEYEQASLLGTVSAWDDLVPVNGADNTDGIIEAAAVGAQTNTVHNLSKATFAALPGFNNQFFDGANSFSTNGFIGIDRVKLRAQNRRMKNAQWRWYVTAEVAEFYHRGLVAQERYGGSAVKGASQSGAELEFEMRGFPTCVVNNMPAAGSATTANPWSILLIDHEQIKYNAQRGYFDKQIPLQAMWAAGSPTRAAYTVDAGQNVCRYFGTSGVIVDLQTY